MADNASSFQNALQNSPGKKRFSKLMTLLISGGTVVFRELFDHYIEQQVLVQKLSDKNGNEYETLKRMRNRNVLFKEEWELLFPSNGSSVTSKLFDITLLYKLLTKVYDLDLDTSITDNLTIIKDIRNKVYAHTNKMEISEEDFEKWWFEIKDDLLKIVKCYDADSLEEYEQAIDALYNYNPIKGYPDVKVRCIIKIGPTETSIEASKSFLERLFKDTNSLAKLLDLENVFPDGVVLVDALKGRTSADFVLWAVELNPLDGFWKIYEEGKLKETLKEKFMESIKKMANNENVELESFDVTVEKSEYEEAREYLLSTAQSGKKLSEIWDFNNSVSMEKTSNEELPHDTITIPEPAPEPGPVYPASVPAQPDVKSIKIKAGEPLEDRGSRFQAYLIKVKNLGDIRKAMHHLESDANFTQPSAKMWCYRRSKKGHNSCIEKYSSGSEFQGAGQRILETLKRYDAKNVMLVVTFCEGGIPLGRDRYANYVRCIETLLHENSNDSESRKSEQGGPKDGTSRVNKKKNVPNAKAKLGPNKTKGKKRKTAFKNCRKGK